VYLVELQNHNKVMKYHSIDGASGKYGTWQCGDKDRGRIEASEIRTLKFLRWMQACMVGRN
jgi:hypothetical protein